MLSKSDDPKSVKVDIKGVNKITLCVNRGSSDDADWVKEKISRSP